MVFNATFNDISVLLVEETGENHRYTASHWQYLILDVEQPTININLFHVYYTGLSLQLIRIMCLSGVTCLLANCCFS